MSEEPKTKKTPRKRRNYAAELGDLQARVGLALRLLRHLREDHAEGTVGVILAVVCDTLEGK